MNNRIKVLTVFSAAFLVFAFAMPVSAVVINGFEGTAGNAIDWGTKASIDGDVNYSYDTTAAYVTEGTQSIHRSNISGYHETLALRLDAAQRAEFMAHDIFSIDVAVPANTDTNGGWIEVNQVSLNIEGYGYVGQFASAPAFFGYWSGSPVQKRTLVVDYRKQKASMPASPGYIEIVIATNSDGVRTHMYFDNAQLRTMPSSVYEYEVLLDNPRGWIRFEDSNSKNGSSFPFSQPGHTQNYKYVWGPSGNGNGLITQIPSYAGLGTAAEFSGNQNCVSSGVVDTVFDPNMTIELWMKATNPGDWSRLLQQNQGDGTNNCYGIGIGSDGSLFVQGGGAGADWYGASGGSVKDGNWHHVVVTYQQIGADLKKQCYIDGVLKGSTTHIGKSLTRTQNVLTIGSEGSEWWQWNTYHGALDEIAFYRGVLSAERIAAHYTAASIPTPRTCEDVLALGWGLTGDVNRDCEVNLSDFAEVARSWMLCNNPALFGSDPDCMQSW